MLNAITKAGFLISLAGNSDKEALRKLRSQTLFCPCCKTPVLLKAGSIKIPHFAHLKNASCSASSEPESEYHLLGKKELFKLLISHGYDAMLEAYIPEIRQRADILVRTDSQILAIEFQCSTVSEAVFQKRTNAYIQQDILPVWVLADKNVKALQKNEYSLSTFQWLFLSGPSNKAAIQTFCPHRKQLYALSQFIPYTKRKTIALKSLLPPEALITHSFRQNIRGLLPYLPQWRAYRSSWPAKRVFSSNAKDPLLNSLYINHISPSYLPVEVGVPVKEMYLFETPSVEWQTWLFLDVFFGKPQGALISLKECNHAISSRIKQGYIQMRNLPLIEASGFKSVIENYILFLMNSGYLHRIRKGKFRLVEPFCIAQTAEQWHEMEKDFYFKHQDHFQKKS
ncbi:competence protein CoiA [Peribacillus sp. SCS-155]|uniref:competence protein CoiA n=1 Tax=Peribacillus sedimenti TaxID=3115297 RepID=UPI003906A2A1